MKMILSSTLFMLTWTNLLADSPCIDYNRNTTGKTERFIIAKGNHFYLNGNRFRYVSGELHYFRAPHQYWRALLKKLRAAGLNAVSTFVEWSFHEPEKRKYYWSGDRNLTRFIDLAAEENLLVILKPGPYIGADRDLGGLPYWLLSRYPNIKLRSSDPNFMREVRAWFRVLLAKVKPRLYGNGGPIILVQIENEYGNTASCDRRYTRDLRNMLKDEVGSAALLSTAAAFQADALRCGTLSNTLRTIKFDYGQTKEVIMNHTMQCPLVNSEYHIGGITHWGQNMSEHKQNTKAIIAGLKEMLKSDVNVNFYVFFGGTNFEFTSGAKEGFNFVLTSYDNDAPITEYGDVTKKYMMIKKVLGEIHPWANSLDVIRSETADHNWRIKLEPILNIFSGRGRRLLGKRGGILTGDGLPSFESRKQRAGLLLYETVVPPSRMNATLKINSLRDRVYVYIDGSNAEVGNIVYKDMSSIEISISTTSLSDLSLLVENQGRVSSGQNLGGFKGILGTVTLDGNVLNGTWKILSYPLRRLNIPHANKILSYNANNPLTEGPMLFSGIFVIKQGKFPNYTFLNPTGWGKGYAWINGRSLGRYWPLAGPQVTLYVPGVYLRPHPQRNLLQLLELEKSSTHIELISKPIFKK